MTEAVSVLTWPLPGGPGTARQGVTCGSDVVFIPGHPRKVPLTCQPSSAQTEPERPVLIDILTARICAQPE